jgi:acetyl esterase/lipase
MSKTEARNYRDIVYGPAGAHTLDLYLPASGQAPAPVIVFVHGGGWAEGDKADGQEKGALDGVRRGYAVASINYRLSGEAPFPAAILDARAAIRFLRASAKRYGLDRDKFAAWGDSAGGHIVMLLGTAATAPIFADVSLGNADQPSTVKAVVDWFGPNDFSTMDAEFKASGMGKPNKSEAGSFESKFLGKPVTSAPELVRAANPITYISASCPAVLIQHGDKDDLVPIEQSFALADALKAKLPAGQVELDVLKGAGHGGEAFESAANLDRVFAFLDRHLAAKSKH